MVSIIVIENGGSTETLKDIVKTAMEVHGTETFLVANAPLPEVWQTRNYIAMSHSSPNSCIQNAINKARYDLILFIDSKASTSLDQLTQMIAAMSSNSSSFTYAEVQSANEVIEMPDLSAANLVSAITATAPWPVLMVGTSKKMLQSMGEMNGSSITEIIVRMMVKAAAQGEEIASAPFTLEIGEEAAASLAISRESTARCLNTAVNSCNIEELFPSHPWSSHEEESAAASYHTLAAHFMRLGDSDSAMACLSFSDQFEDSPRSLALKGLIAQSRGELLGAVANMVSSLQQYETRKNDDNKSHYLSFKPNDLEVVNSKLHAGLEALNLRDNESALSYFAEAVFDFDPFYKDLGVSTTKR